MVQAAVFVGWVGLSLLMLHAAAYAWAKDYVRGQTTSGVVVRWRLRGFWEGMVEYRYSVETFSPQTQTEWGRNGSTHGSTPTRNGAEVRIQYLPEKSRLSRVLPVDHYRRNSLSVALVIINPPIACLLPLLAFIYAWAKFPRD